MPTQRYKKPKKKTQHWTAQTWAPLSRTKPKAADRIMPWGKYRGQTMKFLPLDYLTWAKNTWQDPGMRQWVEEEIRRRNREEKITNKITDDK